MVGKKPSGDLNIMLINHYALILWMASMPLHGSLNTWKATATTAFPKPNLSVCSFSTPCMTRTKTLSLPILVWAIAISAFLFASWINCLSVCVYASLYLSRPKISALLAFHYRARKWQIYLPVLLVLHTCLPSCILLTLSPASKLPATVKQQRIGYAR